MCSIKKNAHGVNGRLLPILVLAQVPFAVRYCPSGHFFTQLPVFSLYSCCSLHGPALGARFRVPGALTQFPLAFRSFPSAHGFLVFFGVPVVLVFLTVGFAFFTDFFFDAFFGVPGALTQRPLAFRSFPLVHGFFVLDFLGVPCALTQRPLAFRSFPLVHGFLAFFGEPESFFGLPRAFGFHKTIAPEVLVIWSMYVRIYIYL
jgi:hypothetical protein